MSNPRNNINNKRVYYSYFTNLANPSALPRNIYVIILSFREAPKDVIKYRYHNSTPVTWYVRYIDTFITVVTFSPTTSLRWFVCRNFDVIFGSTARANEPGVYGNRTPTYFPQYYRPVLMVETTSALCNLHIKQG